MSIAQNLRILNKPISELAMLPQETIMTMAQSGQIPVAFVAPILAEKAEQAKASANAAAMSEQQQMPPGTVLESLIAQNAANEAQEDMPMMAPGAMGPQPEDVGIGALPVPDEMIPGLAGGGIIAFDEGGPVARYNVGGNVSLTDVLRTLTMDERRFYQQTGRLPSRAQTMLAGQPSPNTSTPDAKVGIEAIIAQAERGEGPNVSRPSEVNTAPQGLTSRDTPFVVPTAPSEVALVTQEGQKLLPKEGMSVADFKARQKEFGITDNVDADLKKQIEDLAAGSKGDREQAKYMAMIQAGLGIMGGSSPYALQNIGTGAQKGVAQYASDIKDIKKEERDLVRLRGELARAEDARKRGDFKTFEEANDRAQKLKIDMMQAQSGRILAEASQTRAKATGAGITLSQMANLRMKAEKEVDPTSVRNAIAKEKKLSKIPKPGENKKFDESVAAAYEAEIEKRVTRALGGSARSGGGATKDLSGYRIVPEDGE